MENFLFIFIEIIIPVFIQLGIGYGIQKKYKLDINSFTCVIFYVFMPSLLFIKIYQTELSREVVLRVVAHNLILFLLLFLISWWMTKLLRYPKSFSKAFINSICFYNAGNYTLPIIQLLYNSPLAISVQVISIMIQNIVFNTIGVFNSSSGNKSTAEALISVFKMPILYSIFLAILLKYMGLILWSPIYSSVELLAQGCIPLAVFILGMQLANTNISFKIPRIYLSNFIRLIISPLLAYIIILIIGIEGIIAQVIIISSAAPTAVNTVLLAIEFNNEPEFVSQTTFLATIFSAITSTIIIYLVTNFV